MALAKFDRYTVLLVYKITLAYHVSSEMLINPLTHTVAI